MNVYPLAVYTANHGLSWSFPTNEISFQDIDACRKAFGQLPDFDSGAKGFDGVWAKGNRVFVMRCQSVPAWDFRNRDATYLAVTWIPREDAIKVDFEKLLNSEAMSTPTKTPPLFFNADAINSFPESAVSPEPYLADGFARAGAIIAGMKGEPTVAIKRIAGSKQASLTLVGATAESSSTCGAVENTIRQSQSPNEESMQSGRSAALMILLVIWFLTAATTAIFLFKWQGETKMNDALNAELNAAKAKIVELETANKELMDRNGPTVNPLCVPPCRRGHQLFPCESLYFMLVY